MNGNNTFATAFKYHELGRCVIPSGGGRDGKSALVQWKPYQSGRPADRQLREWQSKLNPSVWAMVTGPVSRLFVVDCDTEEAIATMEAVGLKPHDRTRKGFHYYVRWPSWAVTNSSRLLPGVDIRGQGGYDFLLKEVERDTGQRGADWKPRTDSVTPASALTLESDCNKTTDYRNPRLGKPRADVPVQKVLEIKSQGTGLKKSPGSWELVT